jgi:hypothetical protein
MAWILKMVAGVETVLLDLKYFPTMFFENKAW